MLSDEKIIEMARSFPDVTQAMHYDIVPDGVIIAFARLIEQEARSECAAVCESYDIQGAGNYAWHCAGAIRGMK